MNESATASLDQSERQVLRYVLLWGPYGGIEDEDTLSFFGLGAQQLTERFHAIVSRARPHAGDLAASERRLLVQAQHYIERAGETFQEKL